MRADAFARRYGNRLVPTAMLLDSRDRMLDKPLVGLSTVDYYSHYLDEAIDTAVDRLRKAVTPPGRP